MCRFLGSHDIHSILGYVACLFSMVPYACVVLHASLFKRKTLHACCHWVPHSTMQHWATMRCWASHWQNPSKRSRPMNLWELNPLVLAYRAKSFPKTELQLWVLNKLVSLEEFHLPSFWGFQDLLLKALVRLLRFLQSEAISISNPYLVTCLTREKAASKSLRLLWHILHHS